MSKKPVKPRIQQPTSKARRRWIHEIIRKQQTTSEPEIPNPETERSKQGGLVKKPTTSWKRKHNYQKKIAGT